MTVAPVIDAEVIDLALPHRCEGNGAAVNAGDRVRIERDETRYPSKSTWPLFRDLIGTVVEVNADRKRPHLTEYGVAFGSVRRRPDGSLHGDDIVTWFKSYEMSALAAICLADGLSTAPAIDAYADAAQGV